MFLIMQLLFKNLVLIYIQLKKFYLKSIHVSFPVCFSCGKQIFKLICRFRKGLLSSPRAR